MKEKTNRIYDYDDRDIMEKIDEKEEYEKDFHFIDEDGNCIEGKVKTKDLTTKKEKIKYSL